MSSIDERLGPKWSPSELHTFFNGTSHIAFKRLGKDWAQIEQCFLPDAGESMDDGDTLAARPRTQEMIKALFHMNKTYLGLSSANALDFAAIMADHYRYLTEKKLSDSSSSSGENQYKGSEDETGSPALETRRGVKRSSESVKAPIPRKPLKRQYEAVELVSSLSDYQFPTICARKSSKGPLNSLPNLTYSDQLFLVDYCQAVRPVTVSQKVLNWCKCEWFYSYVDKGFFQLNEFEDCLRTLGLRTQESRSLSEWRTLRYSLGKPRRLSHRFLSDERKRLKKYREAVKVLQQGKVLPSDYHDLLPYLNLTPGNVTPKLMVGTKVLAVHPKTKEVKSGSILTLDPTKYHVQFDLPELGVCLISDTQLSPAYGEDPHDYAPSGSGFVFQPRVLNEREQGYSGISGEKFKAGVNIYAMAFLLKLLERKEALLELLKKLNEYCQSMCRDNGLWRPQPDFQQQYAWTCVCIQAINTAITPVLEVFRLRSSVPDHPARCEPRKSAKKPTNERLESLRTAASSVMQESQAEIEEKTERLLPNEQQKLKEFVKSSIVLLSLLESRDKDEQSWVCVDEALAQLTPVCESNKDMYDRIRASVTTLKERLKA